jgi:glucose/mannose transport system permease protein
MMVDFFKRHPLVVMIIPFGLVFYFIYVGIGWNLWVSVSDWKGLMASYNFQGFDAYLRMLNDSTFWISLKNTLVLFTIIPICLLVGLFLAIVMDQGLKGTNLFRNLFLLPFALSFVVTGTLWAWMYNPANGIINSLFRSIGWDFLIGTWHTSQQTVMPSIMLALVWQFSGYVALVFLGGIKSVPQNQIQAAQLDGASTWRIYRRLILPQLKAPMTTAIVIIAMFALRSFDFIWVLTGGGPGYASHTLPIQMYKETFLSTRFVYGSAIGNVLLVLVLVLVVPFTYQNYRR